MRHCVSVGEPPPVPAGPDLPTSTGDNGTSSPSRATLSGTINRSFSLADGIEAKLAAARKRVDALTQAVLAKAFRGELVPTEAELARREGRDYEPASALLERVRAERAGTPKPPRRRK